MMLVGNPLFCNDENSNVKRKPKFEKRNSNVQSNIGLRFQDN